MFIHRKLTTTCCVAVLALGLVACGSSDDDTSMTDPTAMEPMDSTAAEQLANAQAAVTAAETMVAALAADSSQFGSGSGVRRPGRGPVGPRRGVGDTGE